MLLDEPTNHLDAKNVAWLQEYLTSLPDVTSVVVSHDSGFLDAVCTDILHYEKLKLKHYKARARRPPPTHRPRAAATISQAPCSGCPLSLLAEPKLVMGRCFAAAHATGIRDARRLF